MTFDLNFLKSWPSRLWRPHFYKHSSISLSIDISFVRRVYRCIKFSFQHLTTGLYVPGKYVIVPVLNVCRTVIRVYNSSGTLSNEAFPKSKFIKSAWTYFDNDDDNLETLKGKKRTEVGFVLAIFGFGGRRTNRCAILTYCLFRKKYLHLLKSVFSHSASDEIRT